MPLLKVEPRRPGNAGGTPQTLVRDPQARKQIHVQKQTKVLHWLKTEIYSSSSVLAQVLGVTSRQAVHKTLSRMESAGLVKAAMMRTLNGRETLWGITEHGQAMAFDPSKNEAPSAKVFEPTKVPERLLEHNLELQQMKWQASQAGWSGWKNYDRGVKPAKKDEKLKHRPDVLVIDPAGKVVAVELELTFKTVRRYADEVIASHVRQICVELNYQHVLWVCRTAEDTERMKNLLWRAVERLNKNDSWAGCQLATYKESLGGLTVFRVGAIPDWTQQWKGRAEDRTSNLRAFLWTHFQQAMEKHKDLDQQAQEEQEWMAATDYPLIQQTLSDYKHALMKQQQAEEANQRQQYEEQQRRVEEANRRLAAQQEAERRANSFIGKVEKLLGG
jgi:hypothetical protein